MRILYIVASFNTGGVESMVRELLNKMITKDNSLELHLLILSNNKLELTKQLDKRIKLHVVSSKNTDNGCRNVIKLFLKQRALNKLVQNIAPDVIHTHVLLYLSVPVYLALMKTRGNFKHFHTIHTSGLHYSSSTFLSKIKRNIEKKIYKLFQTNIVCITPVLNNILINYFKVPKSRIFNISNGVDIQKFNPTKIIVKDNSEQFNLVYLARLDKGKNHLTLLKAIKLIQNKIPSVKLHLIGDGPERENITSYIHQNSLYDFVELHGNIQDVERILKIGHMGVFPSEFEGCSVAILEMMASGLPIACSAIPAFTSIFDTSEVLFFDCQDYEKIALHIENLYKNEELRKKLANKSIALSKKFSLDSMVTKHLQAYQNELNV